MNFIICNDYKIYMSVPSPERIEIVQTVREMMNEFNNIYGIDNKEFLFKQILDYLITKPDFMRCYRRFRNTVLQTIRKNQLIRHIKMSGEFTLNEDDIHHWDLLNPSPVINYNYYYHNFMIM